LTGCAVDNDVLHKGASFQLLSELLPAVAELERCGVLGQARFVVGKRLRKYPPACGADVALAYLERTLADLDIMEPTSEEIATAAELEAAAQRLAVGLDSGESLLAAVTGSRKFARLFTGDKRAIEALEKLLEERIAPVEYLMGRLVCLEQGLLWMLTRKLQTMAKCREAICRDKGVDTALAICFSCSSPEVPDEGCREGLRAYIESLRGAAPQMLAPG
jgi:hypothetical protein